MRHRLGRLARQFTRSMLLAWWLGTGAPALATAAPALLDVDGNGTTAAETDGRLILGHLFGMDASALPSEWIDPSGSRGTAATVRTHLGALIADEILDIDGNGHQDALTDGVLIGRYLSGYRGDALIAGAIESTDCLFCDANEIDTRLASLTEAIGNADNAFATRAGTARFLTQATFGPRPSDIDALTGRSAAAWLLAEFAKPASLNLPIIADYAKLVEPDSQSAFPYFSPTFAFWINAITGDDQLRQRMAFALSEILVVSVVGDNRLREFYEGLGYYQDLLTTHAFGNYRDLLEAVTYSPAMASYLTYLGNEKADPTTGRVPDENYAREIMQLFTIGLLELNDDGSLRQGQDGQPIETYDNDDITGLARVFTGLNLARENSLRPRRTAWTQPLQIYPNRHSPAEKSFLGLTIPPGTDARTSITLALDHLFTHANLPPFIARQLIQRFVTSDPAPGYVQRVATAFTTGQFTLPNQAVVGTGQRGDLKATLAAILFDDQARSMDPMAREDFGKVREPIIRFTHWARAFNVADITPEFIPPLWNTSAAAALAQHPYAAPSVFNFFRPGYIAPHSLTGTAGMTVPELQIVTASSVPGYINFMSAFINGYIREVNVEQLALRLAEEGIALDASRAPTSFIPDYTALIQRAENPTELLDYLDELLCYGTLSAATEQAIIQGLTEIPIRAGTRELREGRTIRAKLAVLLLMTSPDYLVQR